MNKLPFLLEDTIVALATPYGKSAIAIIRISGKQSFEILDKIYINLKGNKLLDKKPNRIYHGYITEDEDKEIIDEVLVYIYKKPNSFTKEDSIEISCHGSLYIIKKIITIIINNGARIAKPGEFTQRAFLNGRFNLAQAEAVADIIDSENSIAHKNAIKQLRGGFSIELEELRNKLIYFASMLELEIDFSEEDVEFANIDELRTTLNNILNITLKLIESFKQGNVVKNGIPITIVGKPNVGKSTIMNALLNEYKAIVSNIPGTTRDIIEDQLTIDGITFRIADTAGLRNTTDEIESLGIELTKGKISKSSIIIYVYDLSNNNDNELMNEINQIKQLSIPIIIVGNKLDLLNNKKLQTTPRDGNTIFISANEKESVTTLKKKIIEVCHEYNVINNNDNLITNVRHYESLSNVKKSILTTINSINNNASHDILAIDLKNAIYSLGEITGSITNDGILNNIFSKFCIGK